MINKNWLGYAACALSACLAWALELGRTVQALHHHAPEAADAERPLGWLEGATENPALFEAFFLAGALWFFWRALPGVRP